MTDVLLVGSTRETEVADVINDSELRELFAKAAGQNGATEVAPDALIREIVATYRLTFEAARDVIYRWIEAGRAVLTAQFRVRLAE